MIQLISNRLCEERYLKAVEACAQAFYHGDARARLSCFAYETDALRFGFWCDLLPKTRLSLGFALYLILHPDAGRMKMGKEFLIDWLKIHGGSFALVWEFFAWQAAHPAPAEPRAEAGEPGVESAGRNVIEPADLVPRLWSTGWSVRYHSFLTLLVGVLIRQKRMKEARALHRYLILRCCLDSSYTWTYRDAGLNDEEIRAFSSFRTSWEE